MTHGSRLDLLDPAEVARLGGIEIVAQGVVEGYLAGKDGLFGFFVGQVMKETQGRANPVITSDLLRKRLGR